VKLTSDQQYAIKVQLGNAEDNLHRARHAARGYDATKQWGQSGQTLAQIIQGYEDEVARWKAALE
jgi:hypothetical protein